MRDIRYQEETCAGTKKLEILMFWNRRDFTIGPLRKRALCTDMHI